MRLIPFCIEDCLDSPEAIAEYERQCAEESDDSRVPVTPDK